MVYYIRLTFVLAAALLTSVASAYLTITGYMKLFSSIAVIIAWILVVLEIAKIVIAGIIVNYKMKEVPQKPFLISILVALVILSAVGHYGFLTSAYYSDKETVLVIEATKQDTSTEISDIKLRQTEIKERLDTITKLYDSIPDKLYKQKQTMYKETSEETKELRTELADLNKMLLAINKEKKADIKETSVEMHKASIIKFTAQMLNLPPDTLANYIILVLSAILDPLALFLVSTFTSIPKPFHKKLSSKHEINVLTCKDYDCQNYTVEDIIKMTDSELLGILKLFDNVNKRQWLEAALCWRAAHQEGITMDLDYNCNGHDLLQLLEAKSKVGK